MMSGPDCIALLDNLLLDCLSQASEGTHTRKHTRIYLL